MSESISGVSQLSFQQNPEGKTLQSQSQEKNSKFQEVLDKKVEQPESPNNVENVNKPTEVQTENKIAEMMQEDTYNHFKTKLQQSNMNQNVPSLDLKEFQKNLLSSKTRLDFMTDAFSDIQKMPGSKSFIGKMSQVQNEIKNLDALFGSKKEFSQGELLALQARLYYVSQHIEVMSKVVDQMTGGIKTILQTNI